MHRYIDAEVLKDSLEDFSKWCKDNRKEGGEITVIEPCYLSPASFEYFAWLSSCNKAEESYLIMLDNGCSPQEARAVLPNSLKTEIVVTGNLREWRHFFKLRAVGTTGAPHPQMKEVAVPLLKDVQSKIPVVFDDLRV